jgi:hypothetical protein
MRVCVALVLGLALVGCGGSKEPVPASSGASGSCSWSLAPAALYASGQSLSDLAAGDWNEDGWPDLAGVDSYANELLVYLNQGDGSFAPPVGYALEDGPVSLATGDFDGDGHADIVEANTRAQTLGILRGTGDGTFAAPVSQAVPQILILGDVAVGDFDRDGYPDVALTMDGSTLAVLLNDGSGQLDPAKTYMSSSAPHRIAVGDFDGDRNPDLAVACYGGDAVDVFFNIGHGAFSPPRSYAASAGGDWVVAGDVNGDGRLDLAVANWNADTAGVFINQGNNGTFAPQVAYDTGNTPTPPMGYLPSGPGSVALGDLDGDGALDMATGDSNNDTLSIFLNTGGGQFGARIEYATDRDPQALLAIDVNRDGLADLAYLSYVPGNTLHVSLSNCQKR